MDFFADTLLTAGAFSVALYCYVLSRRLKRFATLESGMGSAIAVLSAQVDDMTRALSKAQNASALSSNALENQVQRAEQSLHKLELMMASLHDLPEDPVAAPSTDGHKSHIIRRRPDRPSLRASA